MDKKKAKTKIQELKAQVQELQEIIDAPQGIIPELFGIYRTKEGLVVCAVGYRTYCVTRYISMHYNDGTFAFDLLPDKPSIRLAERIGTMMGVSTSWTGAEVEFLDGGQCIYGGIYSYKINTLTGKKL